MAKLKTIHVVYANWCPHCVPTTVEPVQKAAAEAIGVSFIPHDIDTDDVNVADELVRRYGDWSPDYLIPQVFLEFEDGQATSTCSPAIQKGWLSRRRAVENLVQERPFRWVRHNVDSHGSVWREGAG